MNEAAGPIWQSKTFVTFLVGSLASLAAAFQVYDSTKNLIGAITAFLVAESLLAQNVFLRIATVNTGERTTAKVKQAVTAGTEETVAAVTEADPNIERQGGSNLERQGRSCR